VRPGAFFGPGFLCENLTGAPIRCLNHGCWLDEFNDACITPGALIISEQPQSDPVELDGAMSEEQGSEE
jgi:hypothetical protein